MDRIIALSVLLIAIFAGHVYCQDDAVLGPETFDGRVKAIDTRNNTVTVTGAIDKTFVITAETVFYDDTANMTVSGVEIGDYVRVGYYKNPEDIRKAVSIHVLYKKN